MNTEVVPESDVKPPSRRDWLALAVLSIGLGLIVLDGTIVGVALPDIIADLSLECAEAQWVNSLYAVVLAALLLSTGKLADAVGRKRLFVAGLAVFMGGSVLAAMSEGASMLIAARAVQALGAAMIMPGTLSTITATFPEEQRPRGVAVWSGFASAGAILGLVGAGAMLEVWSWRSIFYVSAAMAVGTVIRNVACHRSISFQKLSNTPSPR